MKSKLSKLLIAFVFAVSISAMNSGPANAWHGGGGHWHGGGWGHGWGGGGHGWHHRNFNSVYFGIGPGYYYGYPYYYNYSYPYYYNNYYYAPYRCGWVRAHHGPYGWVRAHRVCW